MADRSISEKLLRLIEHNKARSDYMDQATVEKATVMAAADAFEWKTRTYANFIYTKPGYNATFPIDDYIPDVELASDENEYGEVHP